MKQEKNRTSKLKPALAALIVCIIFVAPLAWWFSGLIRGNYYIYQLCQIKSDSAQDALENHSYHLNTFTDEMSSWEIEVLYNQSLRRITSSTKVTPSYYEYSDTLDWPRLKVVWQIDQHYLAVTVAMSNDNDSISWEAFPGQYDPAMEQTPAKLIKEADIVLPIRK